MNLAVILLAVAGVLAVVLRLLRALFAGLRGGVDEMLAGDIASSRAQRGDLTGLDEARSVAAQAHRRRLVALGGASVWLGLLVIPALTPWPTPLYAIYSLLWLLPRATRHAPST